MAYGTVVMGDTEYETVVPFEAHWDGDSNAVTYRAPGQDRIVVICEHCGNCRLEPIVLSSVTELLNYGWIKQKET